MRRNKKSAPNLSKTVSSIFFRVFRRALSRDGRAHHGTPHSLSAFTIAELIVVIAILAVLATIGFLALSGYQRDAREAAARANLETVYKAIASESAATGNSPRYYVVHDPAFSLSGAVVVFGDSPVMLAGGAWDAPGTNYSAGNPDYAKLRLDREKFKIVAWGSRFPGLSAGNPPAALWRAFGFSASAETATDPNYFLVGAADALDASGTKPRVRSYAQVAALLPSETAVVVGDYPVGLTPDSPGGLVKDVADPSSTGALIDGATVGSVPGCDADGDFSGYNVSAMESGESKPVSKTTANGRIDATAYCSFGALSVSSEAATCDDTYVPVAGPACAKNECGGTAPSGTAHTESNANDQTLGTDWHYSATAGTCTYACNSGYSWDGSSCKADCAGSASDVHLGVTYALSSVPALVHGASASFSGTAAFGASPANGELTAAFAYSCSDGTLAKTSTDGSGSCQANYTWNANWTAPSCEADARTFSCTAKPATGTVWNSVDSYQQTWNGSAWSPADSATAYSTTASATACNYQCASGYGWDGSVCQVTVDASCGTAHAAATYSYPTADHCAQGTKADVDTVASDGGFDWTCAGAYGGTAATCSAPKKVDGVCGSSNGATLTAAPSTNLCSIGTASLVTGTGPWNWTCSGVNSGNQASCSAQIASYAVTFDGNGGSGHSPTTKSVNHGAQVGTLPSNPTRTGYTFNGWFTATSGGTQITTATVVTAAVTWYAQWTASFTCGTTISVGGYAYATKLGPDGKCWTSTNMKHTPSAGNRWCYSNLESNCTTYGALYDWTAATSTLCSQL
ncbi:MAG: hypothetical protein QG650_1120 [Patescibacteria group bacterium]|nr:hypothetical protein [Patescibacteria group bacterium]